MKTNTSNFTADEIEVLDQAADGDERFRLEAMFAYAKQFTAPEGFVFDFESVRDGRFDFVGPNWESQDGSVGLWASWVPKGGFTIHLDTRTASLDLEQAQLLKDQLDQAITRCKEVTR